MSNRQFSELTLHHITSIKAEAVSSSGTGWLWILSFDGKDLVQRLTLFMPYETALEYALAINACNNREAADADAA